MENKGVYLEVLPEEMLVFTDGYREGWKPAPEPFVTAILFRADTPDGGTSYALIARHRSAQVCKTRTDMGFLAGSGTVVDQLEAYAETLM